MIFAPRDLFSSTAQCVALTLSHLCVIFSYSFPLIFSSTALQSCRLSRGCSTECLDLCVEIVCVKHFDPAACRDDSLRDPPMSVSKLVHVQPVAPSACLKGPLRNFSMSAKQNVCIKADSSDSSSVHDRRVCALGRQSTHCGPSIQFPSCQNQVESSFSQGCFLPFTRAEGPGRSADPLCQIPVHRNHLCKDINPNDIFFDAAPWA